MARGVPEGSEAWLDAQAALSDLEAKRAPVTALLADLEELALDRGATGKPAYPALDALIVRAGTLAGQQSARIAGLDAALRTP